MKASGAIQTACFGLYGIKMQYSAQKKTASISSQTLILKSPEAQEPSAEKPTTMTFSPKPETLNPRPQARNPERINPCDLVKLEMVT